MTTTEGIATAEAEPRSVHFSSARDGEPERDEWRTPPGIFDIFHRELAFDRDLAADDSNHLLPEYFTRETDAFEQAWNGRCFCNPPYSRLLRWVSRARSEVILGNAELVALLIPARVETQVWQNFIFLPEGELFGVTRRERVGPAKGVERFRRHTSITFHSAGLQTEVRFLRSRIPFLRPDCTPAKNGSPFGSALVIFSRPGGR